MDNSFGDPIKIGDYLEHHGILGMKWGKQNGPPYPLSDKVHNAVVRRAKNKREKILRDPEKLSKHIHEFTDEEIDTAIKRFEQKKKVDAHRTKKPQPALKLSFIKRLWSKDIKTLSRHVDSFTPEELARAREIIEARNKIYYLQIEELQKPNKYLSVGASYLKTISDISGSTKNIIGNTAVLFGLKDEKKKKKDD